MKLSRLESPMRAASPVIFGDQNRTAQGLDGKAPGQSLPEQRRR